MKLCRGTTSKDSLIQGIAGIKYQHSKFETGLIIIAPFFLFNIKNMLYA